MNDNFSYAAKLALTIAAGYVLGAAIVSKLIKSKVIVAKRIDGTRSTKPKKQGKMKFVGFGSSLRGR